MINISHFWDQDVELCPFDTICNSDAVDTLDSVDTFDDMNKHQLNNEHHFEIYLNKYIPCSLCLSVIRFLCLSSYIFFLNLGHIYRIP